MKITSFTVCNLTFGWVALNGIASSHLDVDNVSLYSCVVPSINHLAKKFVPTVKPERSMMIVGIGNNFSLWAWLSFLALSAWLYNHLIAKNSLWWTWEQTLWMIFLKILSRVVVCSKCIWSFFLVVGPVAGVVFSVPDHFNASYKTISASVDTAAASPYITRCSIF